MKGTMLYGPRDIRFEDRPEPKIDAASVKPGRTVVVVGDGAVGLLAVLSAKQMGVSVSSP